MNERRAPTRPSAIETTSHRNIFSVVGKFILVCPVRSTKTQLLLKAIEWVESFFVGSLDRFWVCRPSILRSDQKAIVLQLITFTSQKRDAVFRGLDP
jgi:hypothetical protein